MKFKIALEEAWAIPESLAAYNPPKGVIGGDLIGNLMDVHRQRLQQMDENDVELMALSLSSAACQGVADKAKAEEMARIANDKLEEEVMKRPDRFAAFIALSMHDPAEAGEELRRCWTQKKGFIGGMLNDFQSSGPDGNTMLFYDQPDYDAFWRVVDELEAPVYIHPRAAKPLIHEQMWKGRPWLEMSALGYADRVGMHLLGIITAGVLDRFPKVKLVVGHMGEHISLDLYRIDHKLNRARFPQMPMRKDKLVRDYFGEQVFITTSGHFSTPALQFALSTLGSDAVMFSIDYPFESIPNGCVWFDEHVQHILSKEDMVRVGRGNALKVFPRLVSGVHGLKARGPQECEVGGLRRKQGGGYENEHGMYNSDWSRRESRVLKEDS